MKPEAGAQTARPWCPGSECSGGHMHREVSMF